MSDPRYASGTSLTRTDKEEVLDALDELLELTDDEYLAMKRLTEATLRSVVKKVREYGNSEYARGQAEAGPKKKAKDL